MYNTSLKSQDYKAIKLSNSTLFFFSLRSVFFFLKKWFETTIDIYLFSLLMLRTQLAHEEVPQRKRRDIHIKI